MSRRALNPNLVCCLQQTRAVTDVPNPVTTSSSSLFNLPTRTSPSPALEPMAGVKEKPQ